MKERPVIFSGSMVNAILEGRKTQTRRVVNHGKKALSPSGPYIEADDDPYSLSSTINACQKISSASGCKYGKPGDRLWLKESFYIDHCDYSEGERLGGQRPEGVTDEMIYYPADARQDRPHWCCQMIPECACYEVGKPKARSGRFMPRWASRITLEITSVRVERLATISAEDIEAEGTPKNPMQQTVYRNDLYQRKKDFEFLWDKINGKKHPWSSNPWVWCISFKKV